MCLEREKANEKSRVMRSGQRGKQVARRKTERKKDAHEVKEEWEFRPKSIEQLMCIDLLPLLLLFRD